MNGPYVGNRAARLARACARGLTLAEMAIAIAIAALIAFVAVPQYKDYQERVRVAQAIYEIGDMNFRLQQRLDETRVTPADLSEIGQQSKKDPWGRPYVYQSLAGKGVAGKARKNKNLVPINTYFDLYSVGKDGATVAPLTAPVSRDDVILANDGRFIGLARDYE